MTAETVDRVETSEVVAPQRRRLALAVSLGAALATIVVGERVAEHLVGADTAEPPPVKVRAQNVMVLPKVATLLPPPVSAPQVVLAGNSHTYTLPGTHPGDPLQPDPGVTLVDQLAHFANRPNAVFYRLSYPNFLPFEMLTRFVQLYQHGYAPRVVVLGLTWRNIGRDTRLRHEIHELYRDPEMVRAMRREVDDPALLAAVDAEVREAAFEDESARTRSDADRVDEALTEWIGKRVALSGRSADLRARIYRSIAFAIDDVLAQRGGGSEYAYDVIDADLKFNSSCLRVLLRLLARHGTQVVIYRAPERTDLPPMADPKREEDEMGELLADARAHGAVVLDARHVVPNEYWGWERETPDRSHFRQPGHELLGRFLADGIDHAGGWRALDASR